MIQVYVEIYDHKQFKGHWLISEGVHEIEYGTTILDLWKHLMPDQDPTDYIIRIEGKCPLSTQVLENTEHILIKKTWVDH